jgi:hypothetical protein
MAYKRKHDKGWRGNKDVDHAGITNADRAERGRTALAAYMRAKDGDIQGNDDPGEQRSQCADLIADLMHLAAEQAWGAESVSRLADMHFQSER